ncbi:MAG: hypothetical protein U5L74_10130 [Ideonella sp.]|nr:hypothetical protein [Ideonella sp.]
MPSSRRELPHPQRRWRLFRANPRGTRNGKVCGGRATTASTRPDTGGRYTVKAYHSDKQPQPRWRVAEHPHYLRPDTTTKPGVHGITPGKT